MSMQPFHVHMEYIRQKLQIKSADRRIFLADAQEIENAIMAGIKERDALFRKCFRGLSLTGSYLDRLRLHVPDEFDMHIKLELPFKLNVIKHPKCEGFLLLRAPNAYIGKHPLVADTGYINRVRLQKWLRINFQSVLKSINVVRCESGHNYRLYYEAQGYGCAHTIAAIDTRNNDREISFDFVPAFEFKARKMPYFQGRATKYNIRWFAVPQASGKAKGDVRLFMACAPHWEREALRNKHKLKDTLRLMKALRDANDMSHLTSYMLKSVFLLALDEKSDSFWHRCSYSQILVKMLSRLLHHLNQRNLPFFLAPGLNNFDRLSEQEMTTFRNTVSNLLMEIKDLIAFGADVPYDDVAVLFDM